MEEYKWAIKQLNKEHEKVNISQVLGIAIVFTSVYLINKEKFKKG